MIRPIFYRT